MELMEKQIAEVIHEYAKEPKPVDLNFYAKVADPVIVSYQLREYISALKLIENEDKASVTYDPLTGLIEMNHYRLEVENPEIDIFYTMFDEEEALAFYAAVIAQRLLHSFEHVAQIQRRETAQDNFLETRLARICGAEYVDRKAIEIFKGIKCDYIFRCPLDFIRGLEIYHEYYQYDPMERLAEIKSYETMVGVMEYLKNIYPNLYEYEQSSYDESLLVAHKNSWFVGLCPTQVYLDGIGLSDSWNSFGFPEDYMEALNTAQSKYSLEDRLRYGLPVHPEEYIKCYNKLAKSKKYKYIKNNQ